MVSGGKASFGTGDIGLGILPFAWSPAISVGGVVHFRDRYDNVRPKMTLVCSNAVGAILMVEEGTFDSLYDETFPGIGIYGGVDWRLSKTSLWCIDLNIGWVFPFVGNDEVRRRNEEAKDDLRSKRYILTKEEESIGTPKISIGISYAPKRSLKLQITDKD